MNIRTTFVMVMFLSVLTGYFTLADFRKGAAAEHSTPWFYTANMEDIRRIQFTTEDNKTIAFRQEDDQSWHFDDQFAMPVDLARWGGVTLLLSGPRSRRALFPEVEEPARFGLDSPVMKIGVELTGDRRVNVALGDRTPDSINYYITQDGNPGLYLIDGTWGDVLSKITTNPPYPDWYYKLDPNAALFLTVKSGSQEQSFLVERFIGSPNVWRFVGPGGAEVNAKRWDKEVFPLLGGPNNLTVVKKGTDNPVQYGLDAPSTSIYLEYLSPIKPAEDDPDAEVKRTLEMQLGKVTSDGKAYYAKPKGQDYVMTVDKDWADTLIRLVTDPPVKPAAAK